MEEIEIKRDPEVSILLNLTILSRVIMIHMKTRVILKIFMIKVT